MFELFANWVTSPSKNLPQSDSNTTVAQNQSPNNQTKNENQLIQVFIDQSKELLEHPDLPIKAKPQIENIIFNIKQIDMRSLCIDTQVKIERILSKDIPFATQTYFSLPKAHAVSVILENGKTAKQTLIDQFAQYSQLLSTTIQESIEQQSKQVVINEKIIHKTSTPKKDFFDL